jgi:hypothetical protein
MARETFERVKRVDAAGKPYECHAIVCGTCGAEDQIRINPTALPPTAAAKKFQNKGWDVNKNVGRHVCPACQVKRKEARAMAATKITIPDATAKGWPTPQQQPAPAASDRSPGATKAIPLLYMALDEAYDLGRKTYREGWSDERIAKETGLGLDFVRKRREDDFGPLADTRIETARTELRSILSAMAGIQLEAERAAAKHAAIQRQLMDRVERLERTLGVA